MRRTTFILAAIMLAMVLKPNDSFAKESRTGTSDWTAKNRLMEVTFRIAGSKIDKAALESIQTILQEIEGVPYVGVNYPTVEINVRYDSAKVSVQRLKTASEGVDGPQVSIVAGPAIVSASAQNRSTPDLSHVTFECLNHDKAYALCEKHFKGELPGGIELENCYTVKINFQTVAHIDRHIDWLSQACLVDKNGKLIKPLSWLEFPSGVDGTEKPGSGLLIFPKIPVLRLSLTLRFLRANGDGYDSFNVEVPESHR